MKTFSCWFIASFIGLMVVIGCSKHDASALKIETVADLDGHRCGIVAGSVMQHILSEANNKVVFSTFNDYPSTVESLRLGKIDAIPLDTVILRRWAANFPEEFRLTKSFGENPYGYLFAKGSPLRAKANATLAKLKASGELDRIITKWCDTPDLASVEAEPYPHRADFTGRNGTIVFATTLDYEPGAFVRNGEPAGFDIDIVRRLASELDMKVDFFSVTISALVSAVASGKANMGGGCITITPTRAEVVDFSDPYLNDGFSIMVRKTTTSSSRARGSFFASVKDSFIRTFVTEKRWRLLANGFGVTCLITLFATLLGTVLAFPVWLARTSKSGIVSALAKTYIAIIQGTPVLVLLMILFYIIFGEVNIDGIWIAIIAFGLNLSAYASEMLRSGVNAVPIGQTEAALALGYTSRQAFFKFVLPQAVRAILPVYRGELIGLLKMTSIVGYIAIGDLTRASDIVRSRTYESFFPILTTAFIYFVASYLLSLSLKRLARHLDPK